MTPHPLSLAARRSLWIFGLLALSLGCGEATEGQPPAADPAQAQGDDFSPPLMDLDELVGDHPQENGVVLQDLGAKFDLTLPRTFGVVETMTPAVSQGSRGVCSVFSTVALMEHLYLKKGMAAPDFSEQYLQWSVKMQVRSFQNTSGSSASSNLRAVERFGIPKEEAWPYVTKEWTGTDDPLCGPKAEGEDKPALCFAQGLQPPQPAQDAKKYFLPRSIALNNDPTSLKTYMFKNKSAFVCGMDFFYQAWSHGGSKLKTNKDYKSDGVIPFPSPADQADSRLRPAGHSVVLVHYDDDKEIARLDEEGNPLLDDRGNPVVDKGAFLIKNSWGASPTGWGGENELGRGFGWISYRYISNYGRCVSAPEPEESNFEDPMATEICGDGKDNDGNMLSDCDDDACAMDVTCQTPTDTQTFSSTDALRIPDNDARGITAELEVDFDGEIRTLELSYAIDHTFVGDLEILLVAPDGNTVAVIKEQSDDSTSNLNETLQLSNFKGLPAKGTWTLNVADTAASDRGTLKSWSLKITK